MIEDSNESAPFLFFNKFVNKCRNDIFAATNTLIKEDTIMPLFRVTVKQSKLSSGIRIERGMSVDVVTNSMSNPLTTNGGQAVADAFMRIYGVDMKRLNALSTVYLDVQRVG